MAFEFVVIGTIIIVYEATTILGVKGRKMKEKKNMSCHSHHNYFCIEVSSLLLVYTPAIVF
jgi:hypothetical protein